MVTTKLKGEAPDVFTGERNKSDAYKQQFQVYRYMNPNNEIMRTPYYHVMPSAKLQKTFLLLDPFRHFFTGMPARKLVQAIKHLQVKKLEARFNIIYMCCGG